MKKQIRDAILSQVAGLSDRDEIDTCLRKIDWLKNQENLKSFIQSLSIEWCIQNSQKSFNAQFIWGTPDDWYSIPSRELEYRNHVLKNSIKNNLPDRYYFAQASMLLLENCDTDKVLKTLGGTSTQMQIDFYVWFTKHAKLFNKSNRNKAELARIKLVSLFLTGNVEVDKALSSSLSEIEKGEYDFDSSERACEIDRILHKYWEVAGRDFYTKGMFDQAKPMFERLPLDIDNGEILASVYQKTGNPDQAEKLLKRVLILREKYKIRQCECRVSRCYVKNLSFEKSKHIRRIVFAKFFQNTLVLSKIDKHGIDHDSIIVANMNSEQVVNTLVGIHENIVTCAIATKDGKFIISAGGKEVYDSRNLVVSYTSELYLWNDKGEIVYSFGGYSTIITALAFSLCEKFFVSCDFDGEIKLWNFETRQIISTIFLDKKTEVSRVEFSPCGNFIAIASGNSVRLFDLKNGCLVRTFKGINDLVTCVKFSPCGKFIFNSNNPNCLLLDHKITQYDVDTGDLINEYHGHSYDVNAIDISPDGKYLVGAFNSMIGLWNIETGELICGLEGEYNGILKDVSFSGNGTIIRSVDSNGNVNIFNIEGL